VPASKARLLRPRASEDNCVFAQCHLVSLGHGEVSRVLRNSSRGPKMTRLGEDATKELANQVTKSHPQEANTRNPLLLLAENASIRKVITDS
jgi:hypothetical protein